jgi:hypothetical protein
MTVPSPLILSWTRLQAWKLEVSRIQNLFPMIIRRSADDHQASNVSHRTLKPAHDAGPPFAQGRLYKVDVFFETKGLYTEKARVLCYQRF